MVVCVIFLKLISEPYTLPIAISVLAALGDNTALALLTCMVFHFCQLLVDSIISAKMAELEVSSAGGGCECKNS